MQQLCHTCPLQLSLLFASWAGKCEGTQNIEIYTLNHFCEVFHFMLQHTDFKPLKVSFSNFWLEFKLFKGQIFCFWLDFKKSKGSFSCFQMWLHFCWLSKIGFKHSKGLFWGVIFWFKPLKGWNRGFFSVFLVNWARFRDKNRLFLAGLFRLA